MSFQLVFTAQYEKRAARFLKRHPELENQYLKTLQLLEMNPCHPSLRLHALSGRLQVCIRSPSSFPIASHWS